MLFGASFFFFFFFFFFYLRDGLWERIIHFLRLWVEWRGVYDMHYVFCVEYYQCASRGALTVFKPRVGLVSCLAMRGKQLHVTKTLIHDTTFCDILPFIETEREKKMFGCNCVLEDEIKWKKHITLNFLFCILPELNYFYYLDIDV